MILKISVRDNDFSDVMEQFCEEIAAGWHHPRERKPDQAEKEKLSEWYDRSFQDGVFFRQILSELAQNVSDDNKKRVVRIVTDSFVYFTNERWEDNAEYLQRHFICEIVDTVTDRWMNGEEYYVFPTSYAGKVLCF